MIKRFFYVVVLAQRGKESVRMNVEQHISFVTNYGEIH
jgi:hypothetical protein